MEKKRILIVEDEEMASKALEKKFKLAGYEPVVVSDGEKATTAIAEGSYDVILLDLVLPKKDGYQILEELKAKGSVIPVVIVSNLGADANIEKSKTLGAKEHFVKSMTPMKQVIAFIDGLLGT